MSNESSFQRHRVSAVVNKGSPAGTLTALKFNGQLVGILSEPEAKALGVFLVDCLGGTGQLRGSWTVPGSQIVRQGAMEARIFSRGEAIVKAGNASVALEPGEVKALYVLLKQFYDHQQKAQKDEKIQ